MNRQVVVFAGPSAAGIPAAERSVLVMRPPAIRGDLDALVDGPPCRVLLLDGLFGQSLAVSVLECVRVMSAGFELWGASSLGALRAAETWSHGMIGVGDVYLMLRSYDGCSDDEVAVAYHPETFQELTVSLVQVRALIRVLTTRGLVMPGQAEELLAAAREIYWYERRWERVAEAWRACGVRDSVLLDADGVVSDSRVHPKLLDAAQAARIMLADVWPTPPVPGRHRGDDREDQETT
jgi:TfuA protein